MTAEKPYEGSREEHTHIPSMLLLLFYTSSSGYSSSSSFDSSIGILSVMGSCAMSDLTLPWINPRGFFLHP